jgi:hypothetical protein
VCVFVCLHLQNDCNDIVTTKKMNNNNNNNNASSSCLFEACDIWHVSLGHVNYNFIQLLINLELLPTMIFVKNYKCEVYVELKFIRTCF